MDDTPSQAPDGLPRIISAQAMRWLLGLSNSRLEQLLTAGVLIRVDRGEYSIASVPAYIRQQRQAGTEPRDLRVARTQLIREKAAVARMDREERQGELVPVADMIAVNSTIAAAVRDRVLAVAARNAPQLANLPAAELERRLYAALAEALEDLSRLKVISTPSRRVRAVAPLGDDAA